MWLMRKLLILLWVLPTAFLSPQAQSAYLTEAQQLQMYRECRATYADKDKYFAKKMCGCLVQAYLHDMPATQSAPKCMKYATTNPY